MEQGTITNPSAKVLPIRCGHWPAHYTDKRDQLDFSTHAGYCETYTHNTHHGKRGLRAALQPSFEDC